MKERGRKGRIDKGRKEEGREERRKGSKVEMEEGWKGGGEKRGGGWRKIDTKKIIIELKFAYAHV